MTYQQHDERPRSIPELRGMTMNVEARERERGREKPYSAASYAAQYGIRTEDAEELRGRFSGHHEIVRQITAMFGRDTELKRRALALDESGPLTPEEDERLRRTLRGSFPDKSMI